MPMLEGILMVMMMSLTGLSLTVGLLTYRMTKVHRSEPTNKTVEVNSMD